MKEDTLEDVMYWTGQLAEAYPDLAAKVLSRDTRSRFVHDVSLFFTQ